MSINTNLKAIDTYYDGKKFRSRLEARWAVFFNQLSWQWLYEHEGYDLPSGRYLPDFYFPDIVAFGEVKPFDLSPNERKKCIELSELFPEVPILLLIGNPSYSHIKTIQNGGDWIDYIPVAYGRKYYPFFCETIESNNTGINHFKLNHYFTANAVNISNEARFEFENFNGNR